MSYKAILNDTDLIFDTTLQDDSILMIDPEVEIEAGTAGSFDFLLPPSHKYFKQLERTKDYIDVYRDNETDPIFSGRVYQIQDAMNGMQAITCEGALAFLSDTVFRPATYQCKLHVLIAAIISNHNDQVENAKKIIIGNITVANSDIYREYLNYETSITRLKDLASTFGGYMMIRKHNGTYYFDWLDDFTTPCTQEIELGSNLIDIKKTINSSSLATAILPLGTKDENGERLTIKSVNNNQDCIFADASYIQQYGYILKVQIWEDVTVASILKTKAQNYLQSCLIPKTEIELTSVDLADAGYSVDSFHVGQKIAVTSAPVGLNAVLFSCVRQKLKLLDPAQNQLNLGEVKIGFVQSVRNNSGESMEIDMLKMIGGAKSQLIAKIAEQTALITGNDGGYVVFHDANDDGKPDEILIMDTASINAAVKVWRWNSAGLGYSSTGYNGTYKTAWTIDGHFNADFITTGILQGQSGNSFWNLGTGEFVIAGAVDNDSFKSSTKSQLTTDVSTEIQYYLSSSSSTATGGSWSSQITWESGKYIWTRTATTITYLDNSTDLVHSTPIYDYNLTQALVTSAAASQLASAAQQTADSKITVFYQDRAPAYGTRAGDLWIDSDDNKMYRYSGSAWVSVQDNAIQTALSNAASAQSTADGKIVTFAQTSPPTATDIGDLWIDTDDNNKMYRWDGGVWISVRDTGIAAAQTTANGALAATVSVYYRSTTNTTPTINTSTSIGTDDDVSNAWEYVIPKPKNACYYFTCEKYTDKSGNVTFSTVRPMNDLTAFSLWCSANNSSYIDGANVYTGSLVAEKIKGGTLTLGGFNNASGQMQIKNASDNVVIEANNNGLTSTRLQATEYIRVDGNSQSMIKIPLDNSDTNYYVELANTGFHLNSSYGLISTLQTGYASPGTYEPQMSGQFELYAESVADNNNKNWQSVFGAGRLETSNGTLSGSTYYQESYTQVNPGFIEVYTPYNSQVSRFTADVHAGEFKFVYHGTSKLEYDPSTETWKMSNANIAINGRKSRIVDTDDYQKRLLYCYETASPMFGDVGEGAIGSDGYCYVMIDPILSETISLSQYQVFLQKYGQGECWIHERTLAYFVVAGDPGLTFGWELKAKQADFDQIRLTLPDERIVPVNTSIDPVTPVNNIEFENPEDEPYMDQLIEHINEINYEREVMLT